MQMRYFIMVGMSVLFLTACENVLDTSVDFDVVIRNSDDVKTDESGTVYFAAGTSVSFDFSGNPDFISFSYECFNETSSSLSFTSLLSWNNDTDNTLQLFLSDAFPGLTKTDAKADSVAIHTHAWVDKSGVCSFPTVQNGSAPSNLSLDDYRGSTIVLAFRYKTSGTAGFQPMWTVSDLRITNKVIKTAQEVSPVASVNMDWTPFDIYNLISNEAPYQSGTGAGIWDTSTPASLKIHQTAAGRALNEDWLISKPVEILRGVTETGTPVAVKNMTMPVEFYTYTFKETGDYTVTFTATNYNYQTSSRVQKTFKIVVE